MKQIFLFIAIISSSLVFAQKNFEGQITYRLHSSTGEKPDAELKVLFGFKKLKLMFKEKETYDQEVLIVDLDSGKTYNVNFETKTYGSSQLTLSAPRENPVRKKIAGYDASPMQPEINGLSGLLGGMLGTSSAIFYLADSLYYYLPAAFNGNKELLMVQKNRIVLGAEIQLINTFSEMADSSSKKNATIITVDAVEVKSMTVNAGEFLIPGDFADRRNFVEPVFTDTTAVYSDSSMVAVDSAVIVPKKVIRKKPAKPAAPKSKAGSKAIRRKEN